MSAALPALVGLAILLSGRAPVHSRLAGIGAARGGGSRPWVGGRRDLRGVARIVVLLGVIGVGGVTGGVAAAVAVAMPGVVLARRDRSRQRDVGEFAALDSLVTAIEGVVAEVRVGAHPAVACETVAREIPDRVGGVLRTAAAHSRLGGSPADGLAAAARRDGGAIEGELLDLAAAWDLAETRGLPLADVLERRRGELVALREHRRRTHAGLAGPRATIAVLAGLPVVGIGFGELMGAAPLGLLLGGGFGGGLLLVGSGLAAAGLAWGDAIIRKAGR